MSDQVTFFDLVTIENDDNTWGHARRDELLGKQGVVFGITRQDGLVKCYVYVRALDRTYGIAAKGLSATGERATARDYVPEFSEWYFERFSYGLIFPRRPEDFPAYREALRDFESQHSKEAIDLFSEYAVAHLEELHAKLSFTIDTPKATVFEYLQRYRQALSDESAKA